MKLHHLLFVAVVALSSACGPLKYTLQGTPSATGADGHLVADVKEDQQLTAVELETQNLAPPARIKEGLTVFIVWQRKNDQGPWAKVGVLNYDADGRKGTLTATVPQTSFDLEVTAEADGEAQSPSDVVVFAQRVAK